MAQTDPVPVKIAIGGNVDGNIVVGDNNFIVNTNHGTIVYKQAAPQVRVRNFVPQPPRAIRGFINRAAELKKLESWISANEMVLIYAPDGMGKSSLLRQVANGQVGRAMPHGVILLECVSINEDVLGVDDIIQRLFDALFESVPPLKVNANTARTYLSNTRPLLLLDEVPLSPALQNCLPDLFPNGAMLFTSDIAIGREDFLRLPIGPLQRGVAVRLLVNKSGLELTEQNKTTFDALCALLGDVSLAVVITGNVIRETGANLEDALVYFQKISPAQQDNLDRAVTYAFSCLQPAEQDILSAAAFTPGVSMSSEWLVAVSGSQEAERGIERLKALGLLGANSPRLRIPPGIRIPAQRLASLDQETVSRRLTNFLIASLQAGVQSWDFYADELGNLYGALAWAIRTNRWTQALQLGRALEPYLTLRGLWDGWRDLLEYLLAAARQSGNQAAEAFVLHQSGVREIGVGTREKALDYLYQALRLRRALGDTIGMAYTQHNIDLLIGPPPPGNQNPRSQPPASPSSRGMVGLLVSSLSALFLFGLLLFWIFSSGSSPPLPTPTTPTFTPIIIPSETPTSLPSDTPTATPTGTPTDTPTPTPSPTAVIPVMDINLTDSALLDTAYLYQGLDSDYFEVPFHVRLSNQAVVDIGSFNLSAFYQANDGNHPALFRLDGHGSYSDNQAMSGIVAGQSLDVEIRVRIPKQYQGNKITFTVQVDRCQTDVHCTGNNYSYPLPLIVYDFIDTAQSATWYGYDPSQDKSYPLNFNSDYANTGWVRLDPNFKLEDGSKPDDALFTHPTWVNNGAIIGIRTLSDIAFLPGDRLIVRVGFLIGGGGDGVIFRIRCDPSGPLSSTPFRTISLLMSQVPDPDLVTIQDWSDGTLRAGTINLPDKVIRGECPYFTMRVDAGPTSSQDWAIWLSAYVARFSRSGPIVPPVNRTLVPPINPTSTPPIIN